jgi:methylglutaconyl-CoA hydratase
MGMSNSITLAQDGGVTRVTLNRPEAHNALNAGMIREMTDAFDAIGKDPNTRVVVLAAEGKSFCAGGDLHWMREAAGYTPEENAADALRLGRMLQSIWECPMPVIARVQGSVYGGGVGLVAACDMAVATEAATFCFSEVKLGLVPAVISPFVLRKVTPGAVRRYVLTADRFTATEAKRLGLISEVVGAADHLEPVVTAWTGALRENAPEAMAACKRLLEDVPSLNLDEALHYAAGQLAERRASEEGREGVAAFLEKRLPNWRSRPENDGVS